MDGNHVFLFLTMPSERKYTFIKLHNEWAFNLHFGEIKKFHWYRELTVSKSSEYKSFKVLDFDAPPNIKRILPS